MSPATVLTWYCVLIVAVSLAGGWVPLLLRLTHRRMEVALSFVSGVMLGVALLHLLPHAFIEQAAALEGAPAGAAGDLAHDHDGGLDHDILDPVVLWLLAGFLAMFFLERAFCFHHHELPDDDGPTADHKLAWTGAAIGLTVHSLVAGVALAASVAAGLAGLVGLGTFLVIVLHKPFDALTVGTLMAAGRRSRWSRHLVNGLFSLAVPVGVVGFRLGVGDAGPGMHATLSAALAFSSGTFLCISLSDVLPELQFHRHDRVKLSLALLLGLAVAYAVARLEG